MSPDGDEVEVRDLDALREHVATGRISDDTHLSDSLTGHSGPAGSHDAFRFLLDMFGAARSDGEEDASGEVDRGDAGSIDFPDLDVTLADPEEPESSEEFVARLRQERAAEAEGTLPELASPRVDPYNQSLRSWYADDAAGTGGDGDRPDDPGADTDDHAGAADPAAARPGATEPRAEAPARPDDGPAGVAAKDETADDRAADDGAADDGAPDDDVPDDDAADDVPPTVESPAPPFEIEPWVLDVAPEVLPVSRGLASPAETGADANVSPERGAIRRAAAGKPGRQPSRDTIRPLRTGGLVAALVLAGGYLALDAQSAATSPAADAEPAAAEEEGPPPLDPRGVADRLAASEGIAFQHMVEGMDSLARVHRVFEVPAVWLEGSYLSDAAAHPEVEEYWERYLAFTRAVKDQDARLFRRSFVNRLGQLDVAPAVVSLRLAQATRRFEETQPRREEMYARMDDLARAALTLHDLMVSRSDDITYTPVTRASAVRDPFLQIYTEDEELQERIYRLLDRIFDDLEALHGETRWTRNALNDGVLESIRSTGDRGQEG